MSVKRLLYIDDNKIDSQIANLRKKLNRSGIELVETFLNLGDDKFKVRDNDSGKIKLDIHKIKEYITSNLFNENFDIVASDYDYSDDFLDGYLLLKWIMNVSRSERHKIRRAKFCLYSAEQDKLVSQFNSPTKIKELVKLRIDDFIDRNKLSEDLTNIFISQKENYVFPEHIIRYLEKFSDYKFRNTFPKFKEKTFLEIAHEIDKDLPNGIEFQKYLVELTVAHLIELNDLPKE